MAGGQGKLSAFDELAPALECTGPDAQVIFQAFADSVHKKTEGRVAFSQFECFIKDQRVACLVPGPAKAPGPVHVRVRQQQDFLAFEFLSYGLYGIFHNVSWFVSVALIASNSSAAEFDYRKRKSEYQLIYGFPF